MITNCNLKCLQQLSLPLYPGAANPQDPTAISPL